jgi:hypothetical protein
MEKFDNYIWKVEEEDTSNPDIQLLPRWYFQDEAEQLNGPYCTRQEATDALTQYVKEML